MIIIPGNIIYYFVALLIIFYLFIESWRCLARKESHLIFWENFNYGFWKKVMARKLHRKKEHNGYRMHIYAARV